MLLQKAMYFFSINEKVTQWIELKLKGYGLLDISDVFSSLQEKANQLKRTTDPSRVFRLVCLLLYCACCLDVFCSEMPVKTENRL